MCVEQGWCVPDGKSMHHEHGRGCKAENIADTKRAFLSNRHRRGRCSRAGERFCILGQRGARVVSVWRGLMTAVALSLTLNASMPSSLCCSFRIQFSKDAFILCYYNLPYYSPLRGHSHCTPYIYTQYVGWVKNLV